MKVEQKCSRNLDQEGNMEHNRAKVVWHSYGISIKMEIRSAYLKN
jgi:hypothetical protein